MKCSECGCTNDRACEFGCYWVNSELCSRCWEAQKLKKVFEALDKQYKIKISKKIKNELIEAWKYGDFEND